MTSQEQFTWAYEHGYNGAWSWSAVGSDSASDDVATQEKGMNSLKNKNDQSKGGRVNIKFRNHQTLMTRFSDILGRYVKMLENWSFL